MSTVNFTKEADGAMATFNDGQTISWTGEVRFDALTNGFSISGIDGTTNFSFSKNIIKIEGADVDQDADEIINTLMADVFDENGGGGSVWDGTQEEYDAIVSPDANTTYFIHD